MLGVLDRSARRARASWLERISSSGDAADRDDARARLPSHCSRRRSHAVDPDPFGRGRTVEVVSRSGRPTNSLERGLPIGPGASRSEGAARSPCLFHPTEDHDGRMGEIRSHGVFAPRAARPRRGRAARADLAMIRLVPPKPSSKLPPIVVRLEDPRDSRRRCSRRSYICWPRPWIERPREP
jgi:hypothetical protein